MSVHINPKTTCAAQALRCAEHLEAAVEDPQRLVDAIRCAHLALMAAMTEALSGSAGIGAFSDKLAGKHLAYMRGEIDEFPGERTLTYTELFERVQEPGRLEFSDPLAFTEHEKHVVSGIDRFRTLVDHPKPTLWVVEVGELTRLLEAFPNLLEKCVRAARHRYLDGPYDDIENGLSRVRSTLPKVSALNS